MAPNVVLTERAKKLMENAKDIAKLASAHLLGLGLSIHIADMAVSRPGRVRNHDRAGSADR